MDKANYNFINKNISIKNSNISNSTDILFIIASGIAGDKDISLMRDSQKYLSKVADTLIIQYAKEDKDITLKLCLDSFKHISKELNFNKYKRIVYIGHSFQAITGLYLLKHIDKSINSKLELIFWDAATTDNLLDNFELYFDLVGDVYTLKNMYTGKNKNNKIYFNKKLIQELRSFDHITAFKSIQHDMLMISAAHAGLYISDIYVQATKEAKLNLTHKIIRNCGHMFGTTRARSQLLKVTREFIKT